ncbi:MAG: DUF6089 family protein [Spirosomataceae bacterium]
MQSVLRYLIALLLATSLAKGQDRWELGGFLGGSGYLGDLNKSDWASKEPKAAFGLLARHNLSDHAAIRASFLHGQLSGRDSHYPDRAFRNFTTVSSVNELTLQAEWHLWPLTQPRLHHFFKPTFSPFLFVGFGIAITHPKADMEHMIVAKPEFVMGAEIDRKAAYSPFHGALPFGAGFKYRPHYQWTLTLEAGFRLTFSDYLDGISFAANPNKPDRYQFWGATVAYRFRRLPLGSKIRKAVKCKIWSE